MHQLDQAARFTAAEDGRPTHFIEHVRAPALSVGTYSVPAGGVDDQVPHAEDEVYVVLAGRGAFTSGRKTVDVEAGTVLFVPAHEEHRFHDYQRTSPFWSCSLLRTRVAHQRRTTRTARRAGSRSSVGLGLGASSPRPPSRGSAETGRTQAA